MKYFAYLENLSIDNYNLDHTEVVNKKDIYYLLPIDSDEGTDVVPIEKMPFSLHLKILLEPYELLVNIKKYSYGKHDEVLLLGDLYSSYCHDTNSLLLYDDQLYITHTNEYDKTQIYFVYKRVNGIISQFQVKKEEIDDFFDEPRDLAQFSGKYINSFMKIGDLINNFTRLTSNYIFNLKKTLTKRPCMFMFRRFINIIYYNFFDL